MEANLRHSGPDCKSQIPAGASPAVGGERRQPNLPSNTAWIRSRTPSVLITLNLSRDRQGQAPSAMLRCSSQNFSEDARETLESPRLQGAGVTISNIENIIERGGGCAVVAVAVHVVTSNSRSSCCGILHVAGAPERCSPLASPAQISLTISGSATFCIGP